MASVAVPTRGGARQLRLVVHQIYFEQLSFWRNPIGAGFTVVFSVLFLVLLGATGGQSTVSYLGGIKAIQYYVAGFAAYGVMSACFNMLAINIVIRREMGLLKRMRLSPLPRWILMTGIFANALIVSAVQVVLLLVVGRYGYGAQMPSNWLALVVALFTVRHRTLHDLVSGLVVVRVQAMACGIRSSLARRSPGSRTGSLSGT